eukprot:3750828-Alexandrium_andersonii.AAC.1
MFFRGGPEHLALFVVWRQASRVFVPRAAVPERSQVFSTYQVCSAEALCGGTAVVNAIAGSGPS